MTNYDINCPYCGAGQDINHDEGQGYSQDEMHQQVCGACNKTFVFYTSVIYSYTPYQAPCLNDGGVHKWKPTTTFPKAYTAMRCCYCDETRNPTPAERIEHGLPDIA